MNSTFTPRFTLANFVSNSFGRSMISFMAIIFFAMNSFGQIGVTVTNPGNTTPALAAGYPSFNAAMTALNATTAMTGPVTFTLAAGSETAPATGIVIGSATLNPLLSVTNTVTIVGAGASTVINAGVGTALPNAAMQDGMIKLVGADWITIDGLTLIDGNTSGSAMMEFGIGLLKRSATDGCNNNTIRNCTITMNRLNNTTGTSTTTSYGSKGIVISNSTATAMVTLLTITDAAGASSNNKIYSNTIQNCHSGIVITGFAGTTPFAFSDYGNDVGGNSPATGNTIRNFGTATVGSFYSAGIYTQNQKDYNISYNDINSNDGNGEDHGYALNGIYSNTSTSANVTITHNTIELHGGGTTSSHNVTGIQNLAGATAASNTVNISNNIIQNCTTGGVGATSIAFEGIYVSATAENLVMNNNTINNNTRTGTTGTHYLMYSTGAINRQINNNTITNNTIAHQSGILYSMYLATATGGTNTITGNTIDNISFTGGSGTTTSSLYGIYENTSPAQSVIANNTVSNLTVTTSTTSSSCILYGIWANVVAATSGSVHHNTVFNLSSTGMSGGTVIGVNKVQGEEMNIYNNKVYGLTSDGINGRALGISTTTGITTNIYNNIIGGLYSPAAASLTTPTSYTTGAGVFGIGAFSGDFVNLYNNTIRLDASSTGAEFFSAAVFSTLTPFIEMRANIFANLSTPGAAGMAAAYWRTTPDMTSYSSASNNNLYYAGTPGPLNVVFYGTSDKDESLIGFKARVAPSNGSSIRENPTFVSTTGSDATYLHINTSVPTQIEGGALPIDIVTVDFDGDARNATTPDIGADEFNGTPALVVELNSISSDITGNACVATPRVITANTTAGGQDITSVTLVYSINGGALIEVPMTGGTVDAGTTSNWTATIPIPTPITGTVSWGVVALDPATSKVLTGESYSDDPLLGATLEVAGVPNPSCATNPAQLTATPFIRNQPATIGEGATTDASYLSPFYSLYSNKHMQMIFPASELIAAGLRAGPINSMSVLTTAIDVVDLNFDFTVKMAHTAQADMSAFVTTGLQQVYFNSVLTQNLGENVIQFQTPFNWNGTSNVVVDICFGNSGSNATLSSTSRTDLTPYVSTIKTHIAAASATACDDISTNVLTYSERARIIFTGNAAATLPTYSWSDGTNIVGNTNPLVVNPASNTTYTVTGTSVEGCTLVSDPYEVTIITLPVQPLGGGSTQCGEGVPEAFVVSDFPSGSTNDFRWYDAPTGGNLLQTGGVTYAGVIDVTTNFYVSESNGTCESPRTLVTATVNQPDPITALISDDVICLEESPVLSISQDGSDQNYSFTWTADPEAGSGITGSQAGAPTTGSLVVTPTEIGTYVYTVSANDGECNTSSTVSVTVNRLPIINSISATPDAFCAGGTATLEVSTQLASPEIIQLGTGTSTTTTYTPFYGSTGGRRIQYILTAADLADLGVVAGPITSFAVDVTSTTTLGPIQNFALSIGHTTQTNTTTTFISGLTQVYNGDYTPETGWSTITFNAPFMWNGVDNIVIEACHTGNTTTGKSASSVSYSSPAGGVKTTYSTNAAGCGQATGTTSSSRPHIRLNANVGVNTTSEHDFVWNPGNIAGATAMATPAATTTYTVTATNQVTGCQSEDEVDVTVYQLPPAPTANNSNHCGSLVPAASVSSNSGEPAPIFTWYDAPTGGNIVQTGTSTTFLQVVDVTTTWYVSETNSQGCEGPRVALTASVVEADPINATSDVNNVCPGVSITLTATQDGFNNFYDYTWTALPESGSGISTQVSGNPVTITPTASGLYVYTVTGVDVFAGCTATDTVEITIAQIPVVSDVVATPAISCSGSPVELEAFSRTGPPITYSAGTGTTGFSGAGNPYWRGNNTEAFKGQFLYKAAMLQSLGMTAGQEITGIGFTLTSTSANPPNYNNYTISIGHTNVQDLTTTMLTGLTVAKQPFDHTPVLGVNPYVFDNTFIWDGVSNIVIQVCWDNDPTATCGDCYGGSASAEQTGSIGYAASSYHYENGTNHPGGTRDMCSPTYSNGPSGSGAQGQLINAKFYSEPANNTASYNWSWSPNSASTPVTTVNPTATTTYTVTATDPLSGCVNEGSVEVTVLDLPAPPIASNSTHCGLAVPTASVSTGGANGTYRWYDAETGGSLLQEGGSTYTTAINQTTTFWVSESDATCESVRIPVTVTVTQPDPVVATSTQPAVCLGAGFTLNAEQTGSEQNYTFTWTATPETGSGMVNGVTGASQLTTPTAPGTYNYSVTAIDPVGPCTVISSVDVLVNPNPEITDAFATPDVICRGESLILTGMSQNLQNALHTFGDSTTQLSTGGNPYRSGAGTDYQIKSQYLMRASELLSAGFFAGQLTSLGFNNDASGGTIAGLEIRIGHTATDELTATFLTDPMTTVFTLASFTPVPNSISKHDFSTPFNWDGVSNIIIEVRQTNDVTGTSRQASGPAGFTACLQAASTSGFAATTGTTYPTRPIIILGGTLGSDVTDSYDWSWNNGAPAGNIVSVSPLNTINYNVTATNPVTGCVSVSPDVLVTVNDVPEAVIATNSTQCGFAIPDASVAGAGGTYNWYDAAVDGNLLQSSTSNTFLSPIDETTTFYVAENNGNCEGPRTAVTVTVNDPDPVLASVDDNSICPNDGITLTAVNTAGSPIHNYTYVWSASPEAGSGITGTVSGSSVVINPTIVGTYVYTVVASDDLADCATTSTVSVTVNELPVITAAYATREVICAGSPSTLVAESYTQQGSVTLGTQTTTTTTGSPFRASVANSKTQYLYLASELSGAGVPAGRITGITFNVTTNTGPYAPIANFSVAMGTTPSSLFSTTFQTVPLTTVYDFDYTPVTGANTILFDTPFDWDGTSNIVIQVCHSNMSPLDVSLSISMESQGAARTTYSTATTGCTTVTGSTSTNRPVLGFNYVANGTTAYNWTWNPGAIAGNSVIVTPGSTTIYTATATNPTTGCATNSLPVTVEVSPVGATAAASSLTVCSGELVDLTSSPTGGGPFTFSWSDGSTVVGTTENLSVNPATTTTYTVTVTDACNNSIASDVTINVNPIPTASISEVSPVVVCGPETSATLNAVTDATSPLYQWFYNGFAIPSANAASYPASETGTYSVRVEESATGCVATSATVSVSINAAPANLSVTPPFANICANGDAAQLTASGNVPSTVTIGTGTTVNAINSSTNIPPYGNTWVANRHQMLITSAELQAQGLSAGSPLTSLAFDVASNNNPLDLMNFTIKLGHTDATALTTTFLTDPTTQVWTAPLFDPQAGWSTHYFNTPFIWDGTSNLLIETHFSNCTMGTSTCNVNNCDGTAEKGIAWYENAVVRQSSTSYVSHVVFVSDDVNACGTAPMGVATATNSFSVRPNMRFGTTTSNTPFVWSPQEGLYTDAAATIPYNGAPASSVYALPSSTQVYTATATTTAGCAGTVDVEINVSPALEVSTDITGPTNPGAYVGNGSPLATYEITADNYSNILWDIPVGALNVTGQGTTSISFNYPVGYTTGTISVTVDGIAPCASIIRTLNIACDAPVAPVVSGPINVCTYVGMGTPVTYTIAPDATVSTYNWTLPPNVSVVSGLGTNSLTITFGNGFITQPNKQLRVTATNGCGTSAMTIYYLEARIPGSLGFISGPNDACGYVGTSTEATYSVAAVDQADSYNWVVPAGVNIVSGQGTPSINVTFDNSYATSAITVNAINNCGTGNTRSITITRTLPSTPGLIAGPTNPCMYMPSAANPTGTEATYSVARVGANTYNWSVPAEATITGHTQTATHDEITVSFSSLFTGGTISVTATNNCGTSVSPRVLTLTKLSPGTPSAIDVVNAQTCPTREYTYTLSAMPSNATSVVWTVPTGGTITSGQGTTSITVSYDGTAIVGAVTATGNNGCGNSAVRSISVKLPACPPAPKKELPITKQQPQLETQVDQIDVTVFPNPSTHAFKLVARSQDKATRMQVRLLDNLGREHKRYVMMPGETLTLGAELKAGAYFVEVMQGEEKVTKRLLKF